MSLTTDDLQAIRGIVQDEMGNIVRSTIKEELRPIGGELEALRNDIKEIYDMLSELESDIAPNERFGKLSLEQKLLKLNS